MKNTIIAGFFVLAFSFNAFAKLYIAPLDELITESDLIIVGTLTSISEKKIDFATHGKGKIVVEKIIAGDAETANGFLIKSGDSLQLNYIENFACVMGSHKRIEGKKGIFLLTFDDKGEIQYANFRSLADLAEIKNLLKKGVEPGMSLKTVGVGEATEAQKSASAFTSSASAFTPYDNCSSRRSAEIYSLKLTVLVILSSILLYWILYRSRFKVR
jgi:hypothetical protein